MMMMMMIMEMVDEIRLDEVRQYCVLRVNQSIIVNNYNLEV